MGFMYNNVCIRLSNYQEIFKDCPVDILDEIRSAVLDDTPIANFIAPCKTDNYLLGQIRMALRDMLPKEYFNASMTGKTIYYIRQCFYKNIPCDSLLPYIYGDTIKVSSETLELLASYVYLGLDITKIDFKTVPSGKVGAILKGLYKGYPMWLLIDYISNISDEKLNVLMQAMQAGLDVHPFLGNDWNCDKISLLVNNSKKVNINKLLTAINSKFDEDSITAIISVMRKGKDIKRLCVIDDEGNPVYNSYQLGVLSQAILSNNISEDMYSPLLSDDEMLELMDRNKRNKKVLNVSL